MSSIKFSMTLRQTNHSIPTRRPDLVSNNKKTGFYHLGDFAVLASENKRKRKHRQILGSCQKAKKAVKHEDGSNINNNRRSRSGPEALERKQEVLEIRGKIHKTQTIALLRSALGLF